LQIWWALLLEAHLEPVRRILAASIGIWIATLKLGLEQLRLRGAVVLRLRAIASSVSLV